MVKYSPPILIEHELIVPEEELRARLVNNQCTVISTSVKDVQNFAKISFELFAVSVVPNANAIISLNCELDPEAHISLRGTFSFYIKSANFVLHSSSFFSKDSTTSYDQICTVADFLNPEKKFFEDGKLTIHMKGMLFYESKDYCSCYVEHDPLSLYLWRNDDHDFTISVGKNDEPKTEIKVHKCVLASRSSVFNRMLKTDMKEAAENKLEIIDFDAEVVQAAVHYLYDQDDYKELNIEHLIGLLHFGDKYDIYELKDRIEKLLYNKLSPANVCQIANGSILLNCEELKDICFRFMIIYIKRGISFDHADTLDVHLASELVQKAALPIDDLLL